MSSVGRLINGPQQTPYTQINSRSKMSSINLLSSITIGTHVLKNRVGMSAMTRNRAKDTYPTELMREYYVQRAVGGAGLIVTEGILISRQGYYSRSHSLPGVLTSDPSLLPTYSISTAWLNAPGIWDQSHIAGWKNVVDGVHAVGGTIFAQVRFSRPNMLVTRLNDYSIALAW